jgi:hypothetical protein
MGREPSELRRIRGRGRIFTTGIWYHRLCRAFVVPGVAGTLSSTLGALSPAQMGRVKSAAMILPMRFGLVSLRELAWPMAELLTFERLNLIALEALSTAHRLGTPICIWEADQGSRFRGAADTLGVPILAVLL